MHPLFSLSLVLGLSCHIYTDCKNMLLYDKVNIALTITAFLRAWYMGDILSHVYGGMVLFVLMVALYFVSHGGMGEGDVKLAAVLGLWLGVEQGLACLLFAFCMASIYGVGILLKKSDHTGMIPFGPFLSIGAFVMYFAGTEVLQWYYQYIEL